MCVNNTLEKFRIFTSLMIEDRITFLGEWF
jgi:hypothetical protein